MLSYVFSFSHMGEVGQIKTNLGSTTGNSNGTTLGLFCLRRLFHLLMVEVVGHYGWLAEVAPFAVIVPDIKHPFLAFVLGRILYLRPCLHIQKSAPRLRMVGKALHEGSIAVFAGMQASHIGIDGIVRHREVGLGEDGLDLDFLDNHKRVFLV